MGRTIWASLRRAGLALVAAALIGVGEGGAMQAAAGWEVVPSPGAGQLLGVAASGSSDAWAVGHGFAGSATATLAEHWDGSAWRVVATPSPGGSAALTAVTALSPTNAWAVGSSGATIAVPLIEHWDGRAWRVAPAVSVRGAQLAGVAAAAASDVWAVGSTATDALIEHWDGIRWRRLASPFHPTSTESFGLSAVTVVSSSDVWAAGSHVVQSGLDASYAATAHWDGKRWTAVRSTPLVTRFNFFLGVSAVGPADVWAVGYTLTPPRGGPSGLVEHWDGRSWSLATLPSGVVQSLSGVAALSASGAWAVGDFPCGFRDIHRCGTLLERWDGSAWSIVPSPEPAGDNGLNGTAHLPGGTVWAVGDAVTGTSDVPLVMRTLTG